METLNHDTDAPVWDSETHTKTQRTAPDGRGRDGVHVSRMQTTAFRTVMGKGLLCSAGSCAQTFTGKEHTKNVGIHMHIHTRVPPHCCPVKSNTTLEITYISTLKKVIAELGWD